MPRWAAAAARLVRGAVVLALAVWYVSSLFQLTGPFWNAGLGDWMDPYFINYLLEHWHHSLWTLADPSSPPMFHPAGRTLGYSHGLILYAPVHLAVRPFLHPFQAYNVTLFLVVLTGTLALYAMLRRFLRLSFVESLLLAALFVTSANVSNGFLGVWSQRASVFLIPPLMWLTLVSIHLEQGPRRLAMATLSGVLAALLYTQDYYTAHFATLFAVLAALLIIGWRRTTLDFLRPDETYAQWVDAPIAVDPSCRSFVVRVASPAYLARPGSAWSLYHLDAMFISLGHSLPTLNGYSAWNPTGWAIGNPHEPGYTDAVQDWTMRHSLTGVCELDIEARTIHP